MLEWLTNEQKELEKEFWVEYKLNADWKIYLESNFEYDTVLINSEFQNSINQFTAWYSQLEINTWNEKQTEAKIVLDWWTSTFLEELCIEWETPEELADKIIVNVWLFKTAYALAEVTKRTALKNLEI